MATVLTTSNSTPCRDFTESRTDEIVCHCLQIRQSEIRTAAEIQDASSVRCVMKATDAGTGCTACHSRIRRLLAEYAEERRTAAGLKQS